MKGLNCVDCGEEATKGSQKHPYCKKCCKDKKIKIKYIKVKHSCGKVFKITEGLKKILWCPSYKISKGFKEI